MRVFGIFSRFDAVSLRLRGLLALVGLIDAVFHSSNAVLHSLQTVREFFFVEIVQDRLVVPPPVVCQVALTPLLLKLALACFHRSRIIEIPHRRLLAVPIARPLLCLSCALSGSALLCRRCLRRLLLFLTLLLFHRLNDFLDFLHAAHRVHARHGLQTVLQLHRRCKGQQFLQNLAPLIHLLIVIVVFIEQSQSLRVAPLGIHKLLPVPIQLPQMQQQDTLLYSAPGALLHTILISPDGASRISIGQIDVAHSIIDLVQIVLILRILGHRLQLANHLLRLPFRHGLRHLNASIKLQFIRGISPDDLLEIPVCLRVMPYLMVELPQEQVHPRARQAAMLALQSLLYVQNGLGILPLTHLNIAQHRCFQRFQLRGETVPLRPCNQVFRIVEPLHLGIASGLQQPCPRHQIGLGKIQTLNVGKRRGCLHILALSELSLTHQKPRPPQERVILLLAQPNPVFRSLRAVLLPLRPLRDAVHLDGLLTLLHRTVEVARAYLHRRLVASHIERNQLREVVLVPFFLQQPSLFISLIPIEISVITCLETLDITSQGRVLLGRTRHQQHHQRHTTA